MLLGRGVDEVSDWETDDSPGQGLLPTDDDPLSIAARKQFVAPTSNVQLVDLSVFLRLKPEIVLLRWFNYHLANARLHRSPFVRRVYVITTDSNPSFHNNNCDITAGTTSPLTFVTVCAWRL